MIPTTLSRRVKDANGIAVTATVEVREGLREGLGAALRRLDELAADIAERCPGCHVEVGEKHRSGCRSARDAASG